MTTTDSNRAPARSANRGGGGRGRGGRRGGRGRGGNRGGRGGRGGGRDATTTDAPKDDESPPRGTLTVRGGGRGRDNRSRGSGGNKKQQEQSKKQQNKTDKPKAEGGKPKGKPNEEVKKKEDSSGKAEEPKQQKNAKKGKEKGRSKDGKSKEVTNNDKNNNRTSTAFSPSIPPNKPQQTSDINYGKGQSITIMHVAEKPSIAEAIAKGLRRGGTSNYSNRSALPVHTFTTNGDFPKAPHAQSCYHKVTSVAGHVFSVDFPAQFQNWDSTSPEELFEAPVVRKPQKGSIVKHLQDEAKGCDFIVLW